jgi:hypothetical protein
MMAVALLLSTTPAYAAACHRYSIWHFPQPQSCGLRAVTQKVWYVELKPEQLQPSTADSRTPAEIEEQSEYDAAIVAHRHELDQALSNLALQKAEEMPIRVGDQSR